MDAATLFKFGKWIDFSKLHPRVKKGRGLGHVIVFEILNPFTISRVDEGTLFKFGKWIDFGKSHSRGKKFAPKGAWSGSRDRFWDEATLFKFRKCIDYSECHTRG